MLSYSCITIDNSNQNGCISAFALLCDQIVLKQTTYIQMLTIHPKGSVNKNLGYPCLLGWVVTLHL